MSILTSICNFFKCIVMYIGAFVFISIVYLWKPKDLLDPSTVIRKKVAIVTGANRGLGLETLKCLLKYDYFVIAAVRNVEKMEKTIAKLKLEVHSGTVVAHHIDLASLKSVKAFADEMIATYPDIHLLLCNGGVQASDYAETEDGFQKQIGINYMSHFYLTHLLTKLLKESAEKIKSNSRVVNVSSCGHYIQRLNIDNLNMTGEFNGDVAYGRSKLAQLLGSNYINRLYESKNIPIRCYAVDPGLVATDMFTLSGNYDSIQWLGKYMKSPKEGAYPIAYCCLSADLEEKGGMFISNCQEGYSNCYSKNINNQEKLFQMSCKLLKIENYGNIDSASIEKDHSPKQS